MRFHKVFTRLKAASGTTLGQDGTIGTPPTDPPQNLETACSLSIAKNSNQGFPVHRIGVSYKYTASGGGAAGKPLAIEVWFFEQATRSWYKLEAAKSLTVNNILYFDAPGPIDVADNNVAGLATPSNGPIDVFVMIDATGSGGAADNGNYTFGVFADLTTLAV